VEQQDGSTIDLSIAQYINYNLEIDGLSLSNPSYRRILTEATELSPCDDADNEQHFIHHDDIEISKIATELSVDKYQLLDNGSEEEAPKNNKERQMREEQRIERLRNETEHLLNDYRMDYLEQRVQQLKQEITASANDPAKMQTLMEEYKKVHEMRSKFARLIGNNIIV